MQFYFNPKKKTTVAHIWTGEDTACKMLSSGGMRPGKKEVSERVDGRPVCEMCRVNLKKLIGHSA